jgi:diguanylate cyclase (GGDEF)-like protein
VSGIGIWESDPAEDYVYCDDRFLEMYGITDGQNLRPKKMWKKYADPEQGAMLGAQADENIRLGKDINMDYKIIRDDGTTRWLRCIARLVTCSTNRARLIGVNIDVTRDYENAAELEQARIKMQHDARHDVLTGLANRRLLDETVDFLFDELRPTDRYAVLHLDLDHFKQINDTLGHAAGDSVLIKVANDLLSVLSADQLVCRVGGDEFVVLFPKAPGRDELAALSQTILDTAKDPFVFEGHSCQYGISVGIAEGEGPSRLSSEIFSNADLALYEAKRAGRGVYKFYSPDLRSSNDSQLEERRELAHAIGQNEIVFFLQPQFDAQSLDFVGAEALVRWKCPRRGILDPIDFMPLADRSGLTAEIDECVLAQVLAAQTRWADAGLQVPRISVNVSGERLAQQGLRNQLKANLKPYHALSLELLETIFLDEVKSEFLKNLSAAREMNVGIELDDFGSGRSSIIAMQTLAPDCVKIDQSLTRPILERPAQLHILKALSQIAISENINVTLEGMETLGHIDAIKTVNCNVLQGYALSHPMDVATFEEFLKSGASLSWPQLSKTSEHSKSA